MNHGRKRALVVSGAVATLLGAGALLSPSSAVRCPANLICDGIEGTTDGLGILPDPTRELLHEIINQNVFPGELNPVYKTVNATLEPAEAPVRFVTSTVISAENEASEPVVGVVRSLSTEAGVADPYACGDPSHDHKDHSNEKHCDEES